MGSGNWGGEQAGAMERPMWHQLGPPVRRQSPVRALCSVILGFTLLAATLALVLSWLLATGILDPGAPARTLDISRLPTPTTRLPRPTTKLPSTTTAPTPSQPTTTVSEEDIALVTEESSSAVEVGTTKPIE